MYQLKKKKSKGNSKELKNIKGRGKIRFIIYDGLLKGTIYGIGVGLIAHLFEINFEMSRFFNLDIVPRLIIYSMTFALGSIIGRYLKWRKLS